MYEDDLNLHNSWFSLEKSKENLNCIFPLDIILQSQARTIDTHWAVANLAPLFVVFDESGSQTFLLQTLYDVEKRHLLDKTINERDFAFDMHTEFSGQSDKAGFMIKRFDQVEFDFNDSVKITRELELAEKAYNYASNWAFVPWLYIEKELTEKAKELLKQKLKKENNFDITFDNLTKPTQQTKLHLEEKDFYILMKKIYQAGLKQKLKQAEISEYAQILKQNPVVYKELNDLTYEYQWLEYDFSGPKVLDKNYYYQKIRQFVSSDKDPQTEEDEVDLALVNLGKAQDKIFNEHGFEFDEKAIFKDIQICKAHKQLQQQFFSQSNLFMHKFLKDFADFINFSEFELLMWLTTDEIKQALVSKKVDIELLNLRKQKSVLYIGEDKQEVLVEQQADEIISKLRK